MRKRFASNKISYSKTNHRYCHCFRMTQRVKAATPNPYMHLKGQPCLALDIIVMLNHMDPILPTLLIFQEKI